MVLTAASRRFLGCTVDGAGSCSVNGTNVYLLDPPETVNNLGPDQKQAQKAVLQLCETGVANCTYTPNLVTST